MKSGMVIVVYIAVLGVGVLGAGALFADDSADTCPPPLSSDSAPNIQEADLRVQCPFTPGYPGHPRLSGFQVVLHCSEIPGFAFVGASLRPDETETNVVLGVKFTARTVEKANLLVELLDKEGNVLYEKEHVEELGPENVISVDVAGLHYRWDWDEERTVSLDFPVEAAEASKMRVSVFLKRDKS